MTNCHIDDDQHGEKTQLGPPPDPDLREIITIDKVLEAHFVLLSQAPSHWLSRLEKTCGGIFNRTPLPDSLVAFHRHELDLPEALEQSIQQLIRCRWPMRVIVAAFYQALLERLDQKPGVQGFGRLLKRRIRRLISHHPPPEILMAWFSQCLGQFSAEAWNWQPAQPPHGPEQ